MFNGKSLFRFFWIVPVMMLIPAIAFSQVNITFSVDMTGPIDADDFDPATDEVDIRGPFNEWGGADMENWMLEPDGDDPNIYVGTFEFSDEYRYTTIPYKFHGHDWEPFGGDRYYYILDEDNQEVPLAVYGETDGVAIHFLVDMAAEVDADNFDPEEDHVVVRGTFIEFVDPDLGDNWPDQGSMFTMVHDENLDSDHGYRFVLPLSDDEIGQEIAFKFVIVYGDGADDEWEGIADRTYTISDQYIQELQFVEFNQFYGDVVTANVTFQADVSSMIAFGFFDPAEGDQVLVRGEFNNWSERDTMNADPDFEGWYFKTVEIEWVPGDSIGYKYYLQGGEGRQLEFDWEPGANVMFEFTGEDIILDQRPWGGVGPEDFLDEDVQVTFQLDVSSAVDGDGDPLEGTFYIAGNVSPLFWIWDDTERDRDHLELQPTGEDDIYEVTVTFAQGTVRNIMYKYGLEEAGIPDNFVQESGFQEDRELFIPVGATVVEVFDGEWGDWAFDSDVTNVDQVDSGRPLTFRVDQNYPNPFNPATTIQYSIPETEKVVLTIYNVLGQQVQTLVNEVQNPGTYQATFDASHLASGVYIYRIQAGDFVESKRMMLIK